MMVPAVKISNRSSLVIKASENKMETTPEKPQESVTKRISQAKPSTVPTDKDFRIIILQGGIHTILGILLLFFLFTLFVTFIK